MNSPVDPALLQLVQQELKSLQDGVDNMSVEVEEEKTKVQSELQNVAATLEEMKQRVKNLEYRAEIAVGRMDSFEGTLFYTNEQFVDILREQLSINGVIA